MKVVPLLVTALAATAGCGSDPFTVVVRGDQVSLAAYRDGDGKWRQIDADGEFRERIEITEGRYSLAWVCGTFSTRVIHSTLADEPYLDCFSGIDGGGSTQLFGMTAPNATVYVGPNPNTNSTHADASGFYGMIVSAGIHDAIVVTADDRIYVERDIDLWTDRELALPADTLGVALETRPTDVFGTQQGVLLSSQLVTHNRDVASFPGGSTTVVVPPSSALVATDAVLVNVDGDTGCSAQNTIGNDTASVELPDAPRPAIGGGKLKLGSDVDWDAIHLDVNSDIGAAYTVDATRDWMSEAGTDAVELPDATELPGWMMQWPAMHANDHVDFTLTVSRGRLDGAHSNCVVSDRGYW